MKKYFLTKTLLIIILLIISGKVFAQTPSIPKEKITDSVSQLVFQFFNDKNVDGIYALLSDDFKKKASL